MHALFERSEWSAACQEGGATADMQKCCWLLKCLSRRDALGWSDILRIGDIWVDVSVRFSATFR